MRAHSPTGQRISLGPVSEIESRRTAPPPLTKSAPDRSLLQVLGQSVLFQEYQDAFTATTGLPLALQPLDCWQLPHQSLSKGDSFCSLLTSNSQACAACLATHQQLLESATRQPQSM